MSITSKILIAASIVLIVIHICAALYPSHFNWGFHFFAFYNPLISLAVLIVSIIVFIPYIQQKSFDILETILKTLKNNLPKWFQPLIAILLLIILSQLFSAKLHLLGDGALLLREVTGTTLGEPLPPTFNKQLLTGLTIQLITSVVKAGTISDAATVFYIVDITAGVIFIITLFFLFKIIKRIPAEKLLLGMLLFFGAGSQFFFGYVENYALLYVAIAAYLTTGWFTLLKKIPVEVPIILFILMVALHIGSITLLPSLILLLFYNWKKNKFETVFIIAFIFLVSVSFILVNLNNFEKIISRIIEESQWNFLPLITSDHYFSYPMFSTAHIIDLVNANLLIFPFGIIILLVFIIWGRKEIDWKNPPFLFLLTATLFGLIFTFITFFSIGMARDWDFMASFFLPLMFVSIYLLSQHPPSIKFRNLLFTLTVLSFLHWISWIGVNSSEENQLTRIKLLDNTYFLGHVPQLNYYENLGSYFWSKNDFKEAKHYFEKYVKADSNNPRILGNISAIYSKLGEHDNVLWALKRAAQSNTKNPGVYINLGVEYARKNKSEEAIEMYKKALMLDSTRSKAYANLGSLFMRQNDFENAIVNFGRAIYYGLHDSLLYRETAAAYFFSEDYEKSLKYFDKYLSLVPNDENIQSIRKRVYNIIKSRERE